MKLLLTLLHLAVSSGLSNEIVAPAPACSFGSRPGVQARLEPLGKTSVIANWIRSLDVPYWNVEVPRLGRYAVEMIYAATPASAGVRFTVTLQGYSTGMTKGVVQATKDGQLETFRVGDMELEPGRHRLFIQPENKAGQPAMKLERVRLRWIGN